MELPVIIVNFKTYPHVDGKKSLELSRTCERVSKRTGASIAVCPPLPELSLIASAVDIPVLSQNIDSAESRARTGSVTLSAVREAGAVGTLINHSECRRTLADIESIVSACRREKLTTIVCSNNIETSRAVSLISPDFVAMEPPELIGGDISVTSADPDIVKGTVDRVREVSPDVKVLTGAGVKTAEDVRVALELGTVGVLLASGVVKSKDPASVLESLASGLTG